MQALDPIYVDFFLPQQALDGQDRSADPVEVDTYPGQSFTGKINAINPQVDATRATCRCERTLGNPDRQLLPGMYRHDRDRRRRAQRHITLPQTAVTYNPYGGTVYRRARTARGNGRRQTFVTTGATRGDQVAVLNGVEEGDASSPPAR